MNPRSLGYRTDLIFARFDAEVTDRGDHLSIRTPQNPSFFWGNFLLFDRPPASGDAARWSELFAREIGAPPEIQHVALGWDTVEGETGELAEFLAAGFVSCRWRVQATARPLPPARPAEGLVIRPLDAEGEWLQSVENQVVTREPGDDEDGTRRFALGRIPRYRAMTAAGLGHWWGAFMGDKLVADLGLFCDGDLGRYQSVQTLPEFQKRGIGGALIHAAARDAIEKCGVKTLVIVSEADTPAQRLYHALGFEPVEYQVGLVKRP